MVARRIECRCPELLVLSVAKEKGSRRGREQVYGKIVQNEASNTYICPCACSSSFLFIGGCLARSSRLETRACYFTRVDERGEKDQETGREFAEGTTRWKFRDNLTRKRRETSVCKWRWRSTAIRGFVSAKKIAGGLLQKYLRFYVVSCRREWINAPVELTCETLWSWSAKDNRSRCENNI